MSLRHPALSIATVHFKRQLATTIILPQPNQNCTKHGPHQRIDESLHLGSFRPSTAAIKSTYLMGLLKNCAKMSYIHQGRVVQANLFKLGYHNMLSLQNQMLNVYVKCKEFHDAIKLFDEMLVKNIVTWNTLFCGIADYGACFRSILNLGFCYFRKMLSRVLGLDRITFTSLLRMSIELDDVHIGRQLHCFVVKFELCVDCFVSSALVDLYAKFGLVGDARHVFNCCLERDLVLWNGIMSCFAFNCLPKEAFSIFGSMRLEGVKGDDFTLSNLLSSSAILGFFELGKQLHSLVIRSSFDSDVVVASTLVDMYAKNEDIGNARKVFDGMIFKNIVSWNTIIVGYGLNDEGNEAIKLLREMIREEFCPDELTLASVLSSCGTSTSCTGTLQVHCYAVKKGFHCFQSAANSLINAYSKCGNIGMAFECFNSIPEPDLVSWTSMIRAYAFHGSPKESIELFENMLLYRTRPDQVSFLCVLSACSHAGLINEGLYYFNLMTIYYRIEPHSEHYTCFIDLLGRAGLLNEAFTVLTSTSCAPSSDMLGAFTGACKVHGNPELARWALEQLVVIEPDKVVNYSLLSNLYASVGRWLDVAGVRKIMRERCDYKVPGCSWIEISGELHTFVSSDKFHPRWREAYTLLDVLVRLIEDKDCLQI